MTLIFSVHFYRRLKIFSDPDPDCLFPLVRFFAVVFFSQLHDFWRLDYWEDDLRRRRRFVRNAFGSTHADVALKCLDDYGQFQGSCYLATFKAPGVNF